MLAIITTKTKAETIFTKFLPACEAYKVFRKPTRCTYHVKMCQADNRIWECAILFWTSFGFKEKKIIVFKPLHLFTKGQGVAPRNHFIYLLLHWLEATTLRSKPLSCGNPGLLKLCKKKGKALEIYSSKHCNIVLFAMHTALLWCAVVTYICKQSWSRIMIKQRT